VEFGEQYYFSWNDKGKKGSYAAFIEQEIQQRKGEADGKYAYLGKMNAE
jgi:hypothetical protein